MTVEADEFLRRFFLHIVPRGFMRIRHFGPLANRRRHDTVRRCRELLDAPPPEPVDAEPATSLLLRLTGVDVSRCPLCGHGRMQATAILEAVSPPDSS